MLAMGYLVLAPGEIFENLQQLKRFGLSFERILNRKWLLLYRNGDISYRDVRGFRACSSNFLKLIDAIWYVLMYIILIRFSLKKYHYLLSTHMATLWLCVILLSEKFEKTCSS